MVDGKPDAAETGEDGLADSRGTGLSDGEKDVRPEQEEVASAGWSDEAGEAAYLGEAAARGESPPPATPTEEMVDEIESHPLPRLGELVERIPPQVRETLDDLFRARFVRVARVPRKALSR